VRVLPPLRQECSPRRSQNTPPVGTHKTVEIQPDTPPVPRTVRNGSVAIRPGPALGLRARGCGGRQGRAAPQWGQAGSPGWMTPLQAGQVTGSAGLCGSFPHAGQRVAPTIVLAPHVAQVGRALGFLLASPSRAATTTPIGPRSIPRISPVPARFFELATAAPRKPQTSIPIPSHVQSIAVSSFGGSIYLAPRPRGEPRTFFVDAP